MPGISTVPNHELTQQIGALLRAGNYRGALATAEALATTLEASGADALTAEAWVAVCRARREMGKFASAEGAGLRAVSELAATVGREHPLYATGIAELARVYEELDRYTQAETLGRQALATRRRILGNEHPDTARSLSELSTVLQWRGLSAESEACAREAVAILARPEHARHPARPEAIITLAYSLLWSGNYTSASDTATEAHRLAESVLPAGHPDRATIAGGLGQVLLSGIRTEVPERLLTGALAIRHAALGEDHPYCATTLLGLAGVRQIQSRPDDSERAARDALRIVEAAYGHDHVRTADATDRLASIMMDREQHAVAEPLFRRAIEIYERGLGEDNALALQPLLGLITLLTLTNRADEAVRLCRQSLDRYANSNPATASEIRQLLAGALGELGYLVEALSEAAAAERLLRAVPGVAPSWLAFALSTLSGFQLAVGDVAAGVASAREAFDLTATAAGNAHPLTIEAARTLASAHLQQGNAEQSEAVLRRALAGAPAPTPKLDLRPDLANTLAAQGKGELAEELYFQIVSDRRRLGSESPALADALMGLGYFYELCGNLGAAEPRYREALEIRRAAEGPHGIGVARALHTLAALHHQGGLFPAAMDLYQQALEAFRKSVGEDSTDFALCQHALARLYLDAGDATQAETTIRSAVVVLARRGERNSEHLLARQTLAAVLSAKGNYPEARDTLLSVLAATRESVGPAHATTLGVQSELAGVYLGEGDLLAAEPLMREVADRRREPNPDAPHLAADETRLAQVYARFGEYDTARRHADRCLALLRASGAADSPPYAFGLLLLADIHLLKEDFAAALQVTKSALEIRKRAFGDSHPLVAVTYQQLAALELDLGRLREASADAAEATATIRRAFGPDHPEFAIALRNEAGINAVAAPDTTDDLLRRAADLERRCYGDNSVTRVPGMIVRADRHLARDQFAQADQLFRESAGILRLAGAEENLSHAIVASRLATVLMRTNRGAEAGYYLRQTLEITTRLLGADHPDVTNAARRLSWWQVLQGKHAEALAVVEQAIPGEDGWNGIAGDTPIPLDRYKAAADAILTDRLRIGILTHLPGTDVAPAYTRLLQDRAREAALLDGPPLGRLSHTTAGLSESLTRLRRLRVQLVGGTLTGPVFVTPEVHFARLARWRDEERNLAAEFPSVPSVTAQTIADALPANSTLVDFVRVVEEVDQEDRSRYAAFVLRAGSAEVKLIDLGAATKLDQLAGEWSGLLAKGSHANEEACGAKVADLILTPLLPHLGEGEELFIVADTGLRTIPFAALPTPDGGRLVDRFAITLLTTATALLDQRPRPNHRDPVVVSGSSGGGLLSWVWRKLTGKVSPATALAARLGVTPHTATADWSRFLSSGVVYVTMTGALDADPPVILDKPVTRYVAPPTRYGVRWDESRLTAVQVRDLKLTPGAVVVAPETVPVAGPGGGEALAWTGRAFRHAGAGTVIFGLWSQPEWAEYWAEFHGALDAGISPAQALRQAQLAAKQQGLPPGNWGGFVCVAG